MGLEIFCIVASVCALMYLSYKGISLLILTPLLACITVLFCADSHVLASYTEIFMSKLGSFAITYFPIFMLSAVFGKLMHESGSAKIIANKISSVFGKNNAILSVVISCAILTYGGISLFVVVFAVYPIAAELFRNNNVPKRLMPGAIALGAFTFTMTCLPGTPAIQNVIPGSYMGTDTFAAPGIGIIAALIIFLLGFWWLKRCEIKAVAKGEGYGDYVEQIEAGEVNYSTLDFIKAFTPIVIVIAVNYICVKYFFPNYDGAYLADKKYGGTSLKTVASNWSIIISLTISVLFVIIFNIKKFKSFKRFLSFTNDGVNSSLLPIFNTASVVGYGAVINSMSAFSVIKDFVVGINLGTPTASIAMATSILCGITGSASGGMTIALESLGETYMNMAAACNISPELIHRVVSIASGSLDTLPHNGAVITLLAICKLTHKDSYKDIFITSLIIPVIATIIIIAIGAIFGSF